MARLRKDTREQVQLETQQQLLKAAAAEFAREGYVGANINRISQAAGFAKGTIYNYFSSKRALMLALINETAAAHIDFILQQAKAEENLEQRLERFFSAGFAFVESHPARARVIINAVYGPDDEFRTQVYKAYDQLFEFIIKDILTTGIERGEFRAVNPDVTTGLLMTIYLGSCSLMTAEGKVGIASDFIVTLMMGGLRLRDGSARK